MKLTTKQAIYLAGLLHDIGKFWQRGSANRKVLQSSTLQMEGFICPKGKDGRATHIHALFTHEFFENNRSVFPGDFKFEGKKFQLGNLSARHHRRDLGPLERIIQYADILSSGHDRRNESEDHADNTTFKHKKVLLLNPFDTIYRIQSREKRSYYPLKKLSPDQTIFANRTVSLETDKQDQYKTLWDEFVQEVNHLPKTDFSAQAATLLGLLKKYTWGIPSATNTMPDISLYDHLKTTAAIAAILFHTVQSNEFGDLPDTFEGLKNETQKRFLLLVGDFSGIQQFIYQFSSKGAAKTLKGRSFYLSLLQDALIDRIKDIFEIEDAHILMSSGGRFQLLLPNDEARLDEVRSFINEVNLSLQKQFGDAIYLATGIQSFAAARLMADNGYSELVSEAYQLAEQDKSRRFASVMNVDFFKPGPTAGTGADQVCHVTGLDLQAHETKVLEDGLIVSHAVYEQIQLGRWLKNARYIVKIRKKKGRLSNKEISPLHNISLESAGITYRFYRKGELTEDAYKKLITSESVVAVTSINNTDFMQFSILDRAVSHTFLFYGAAWVPDDLPDEKNGETRPVEFTDIAEDGTNNLMAVLRLDVDSLGRLFREGLEVKDGTDRYLGSISRFSSISEKLDLFFGGYINHLISEIYLNEEELDKTLLSNTFGNRTPNQYILPVYAGGDDVFIICRWDIAPQLARRINTDFKTFTNNHKAMSLSGGVSMVHGKYPIHKAAQEAEKAEYKAKALPARDKTDGKDAFCMFGQAMSWCDFELATSYASQIVNWQKEMKTRTLLGFLRRLFSEYHEQQHFGKWRWRSAYRLKRIGKRYKKEEEMIRLAGWLFTGRYEQKKLSRVEILAKEEHSEINRPPELIDLTGFTVRWVQNITRNKT